MEMPLDTEVDLGPGHTVLDGDPAPPRNGQSTPPLFGPRLLWQRSPISATAELVFRYCGNDLYHSEKIFVVKPGIYMHQIKDNSRLIQTCIENICVVLQQIKDIH